MDIHLEYWKLLKRGNGDFRRWESLPAISPQKRPRETWSKQVLTRSRSAWDPVRFVRPALSVESVCRRLRRFLHVRVRRTKPIFPWLPMAASNFLGTLPRRLQRERIA